MYKNFKRGIMLQQYDNNMTVSGLCLPVAGLGTVKFGRNQGVKYPSAFALPGDNSLKNLLAQAYDLGIRLLDTAPAYGSSEARLGQLLPRHNDWLISTKVGEQFHNGQSQFDFSEHAIRTSIRRSLKRLQRQHVDIVLIHSDGYDEAILRDTAAVETLQQLKADGLIRAIGLSGKTCSGGIAALRDYDLDIAMITHNPIYQAEQAVITTA
ncbi:MAG: aldo/keto reductase, partial [Gammaproteobacteria bacterium]